MYRCQYDELSDTTNKLFESCLPAIPQILKVFQHCDDVSKECALLLRDVAEVQLPLLHLTATRALYSASLESFKLFSIRFQIQALSGNGSQSSGIGQVPLVLEEEFRNEILLYCLELLNHLVTKDLIIEDNLPSSTTINRSNDIVQSQSTLIPQVLLTGLEIVLPVITADLLRTHPSTADKYFSFLSLLINAYENELADKVASSIQNFYSSSVDGKNGNPNLLAIILDQALWAAGSLDSTVARLALQVIL
jgi:hypothetical protein